MSNKDWPSWEVFVRARNGLDHRHVGSLHAAHAEMAIDLAHDVYARRMEGVSIWVVKSSDIRASEPKNAREFYEISQDKNYRHPTFYELPKDLDHI
jgi:ring-1,2-phenylacetyl-CoA epoxidase subunit PaaB